MCKKSQNLEQYLKVCTTAASSGRRRRMSQIQAEESHIYTLPPKRLKNVEIERRIIFFHFPANDHVEQWTSQNLMFSSTRPKRRRKKSPSPISLMDSRRLGSVGIFNRNVICVSTYTLRQFLMFMLKSSGFPRDGPDWQLRLTLPGAFLRHL